VHSFFNLSAPNFKGKKPTSDAVLCADDSCPRKKSVSQHFPTKPGYGCSADALLRISLRAEGPSYCQAKNRLAGHGVERLASAPAHKRTLSSSATMMPFNTPAMLVALFTEQSMSFRWALGSPGDPSNRKRM
jgi:hypothetical protein